MWRKSWCGGLLLLALVIATAVRADETTPEKPITEQPAAERSAVTRADLAAAYLRLEQAFFANPPQGEQIARINRGFDQATMAFFLGRNAEAIQAINELTGSLSGDERSLAERAMCSVKVAPEPAVWPLDANGLRQVRAQSIYDVSADESGEHGLEVRLLKADGQTAATIPLVVTLGPKQLVDATLELPEPVSELSPGRYQFELGVPGKPGVIAGRVNVAATSLDTVREANVKRLSAITTDSPGLEQALASCRARNQLLTDHPSEVNSAQFLADINQLSGEVHAEIDALAAGKNPYRRKLGDTWRVFVNGKRDIPLRVYAPKAAQDDTALPLLVVLHGMGGDENMFLEAYGAGIIRKIAEERAVLVASPLTYTFGSDIRSLEALVDALSHDYAIDRNQIYVLGHSLGAGATASLARGHADTIAAACCIAGGSFTAAPETPPILVVIPELDAVVPPARVRSSADRAASAGMPIEVREMPDYGHTLAVGIALPDAVDWLLKHRRQE